jgi:hypothetical protein
VVSLSHCVLRGKHLLDFCFECAFSFITSCFCLLRNPCFPSSFYSLLLGPCCFFPFLLCSLIFLFSCVKFSIFISVLFLSVFNFYLLLTVVGKGLQSFESFFPTSAGLFRFFVSFEPLLFHSDARPSFLHGDDTSSSLSPCFPLSDFLFLFCKTHSLKKIQKTAEQRLTEKKLFLFI